MVWHARELYVRPSPSQTLETAIKSLVDIVKIVLLPSVLQQVQLQPSMVVIELARGVAPYLLGRQLDQRSMHKQPLTFTQTLWPRPSPE